MLWRDKVQDIVLHKIKSTTNEDPSIEIIEGDITNVFFVKHGCITGMEEVKVVYIVHSRFPALCFRILKNCTVDVLKVFATKYWENLCGVDLKNPALMYRKSRRDHHLQEISNHEKVHTFPNRAAFVFTSSNWPVKISKHSGYLWTCGSDDCDKGNSYRGNLEKHLKLKGHTLLWSYNMAPLNWGHEKTKCRGNHWAQPKDMEHIIPLLVSDGHSIELSDAMKTREKIKPIRSIEPITVDSDVSSDLHDEGSKELQEPITIDSDVSSELHDEGSKELQDESPGGLKTMCGMCDKIISVKRMELHVNLVHLLPLGEYLYNFGDPATNKTDHIILREAADEDSMEEIKSSHVVVNPFALYNEDENDEEDCDIEPYKKISKESTKHNIKVFYGEGESQFSAADRKGLFDERTCHAVRNLEKEFEDSGNASDLPQTPDVRKSKRVARKPVVEYDDMEIVDDSDYDKDYITESDGGDSDSSHESDQLTTENTASGIGSKIFERNLPDSDFEEDMDLEREARRKQSQKKRREDILHAANNVSSFEEYVPDPDDEKWERRLLLRFTQTDSKKYRYKKNQIPSEAREAMGMGYILTGKNAKYQSATVIDRRNNCRRLLGAYQKLLNETRPGMLPDGKIKYRYFVDFDKDHYLRPVNLLPLIEKFIVPSVKSKMYSSLIHLYDELAKYVDSLEGFAAMHFHSDNDGEMNRKTRDQIAFKRQKEYLEEVERVKWRMNSTNPYKIWRGEVDESIGLMKDYKEEFENVTIPNPKEVVPKYLESKYVKNLEMKLLELAQCKEKDITWKEYKEMQDDVMLRLGLKAGNRTECYSNLTTGDLAQALSRGLVDIPWISDVDTDIEDLKECFRGYVLVGDFHKTLDRQNIWLWASQVDMAILRSLEELGARYLRTFGIERSSDSPLFINNRGGQCISAHYNLLSFSKFNEITGVPKMTLYIMRKMFINWSWNQSSAILREHSLWAAGHSAEVQEQYYVTKLSKRLKSGQANAAFRSHLQLQEDSVSQDIDAKIKLCNEQEDRFHQMNKDIRAQRIKLYVDLQSRGVTYSQPTKKKMITKKAKEALIEMLVNVKLSNIYVSKYGNIADILLTKKGKANLKNQILILRMLDMVPSEWPCYQALYENFLLVSNLISSNITEPMDENALVRRIEYIYTDKLCRVLVGLGQEKASGNTQVIKLLKHLQLETGSDIYDLGSKALATQIKNFKSDTTAPSQDDVTVTPLAYVTMIKERQKHNVADKIDVKEKDVQFSESGPPESTSEVDDVSSVSQFDEKVFHIEDTIVNLAESPFKTRVRIGKKFEDSKGPIQVTTIHEIKKLVKLTKDGNMCFNNVMRRDLLKIFILKAQNPLTDVRKDIMYECVAIWRNESIDIAGKSN